MSGDFNTNQETQFTSEELNRVPKDIEMKISMDGNGGLIENVFDERLWRSVKY